MTNDNIKNLNIRIKSEKGASLQKIYEQAFPELNPGDIVKGKIVRSLANGVIIDLGLKSEAFLPLDEFDSADEVVEGKEVDVLLESIENKEGVPIISKRKAEFQIAWNVFEEKSQSTETIPAKVTKKVKGGLIVQILSQEAFLPGSQIDVKPVFNFDALIGQTFEVRIISLNPAKHNIIVSRRVLLEEKINEARQRVFSTVKIGDVVEGTVTSLADFGAFIDIDGVDALLHISDLSWDKVVHPKEVVNIGEKIQVKILNLDPETFRITVGRKQLEKHPWEEIENKYQIGSKISGQVTALAEYGAFVELEKNVEGLIHISEMSWNRSIHHPSQILKVGDLVEAVVLNIDRDNRRISLGLKQTLPDPWSVIEETHQIGQKVEGRITSLKNFGAFVELEPGIEGLIRNQDLSWTKRVRHPREIVKKNQKVEAMILDIDKENRQLALGLKQTQEDPFYTLSTEFKVGDTIRGRIVEIARMGIVVNLPHSIEGFVPKSQLFYKFDKKEDEAAPAPDASPSKYQIGEEIELKISFIDYDQRKVGLSEKALYAPQPSLEELEPRREPTEVTPKPVARRKPRRKMVEQEMEEEEMRQNIAKFTFEDHLPDLDAFLDDEGKSKRRKR
jgi:small subunit ribosomal protein S1